MNYNSSGRKKAVVFGSTGLVGKELVRVLIARDDYDKVIAITRKPLLISDPKLEEVHLDEFSQLADLKERLHATEYYCCIGTTIAKAGSKDFFRQVDVDIPVQIAGLAELLSIPVVVIISSIGANIASPNFYLRTKGEMEKNVREVFSGNLKIVRPSLLMGKRDEYRFGEKVSAGFMKIFGWLFAGPLKKYKGIDARHLAVSMIKISGYPPDKVIYESNELQN